MLYLTFEEFEDMGGTLEETAFNDLEFEAETYIDWYTFDRLKNEEEIPDRVKKCMYHIIKLLNDQMNLFNNGSDSSNTSSTDSNKQIAAQSNDGVSTSYNTLSAKDAADTIKDELKTTVQMYLNGVKNSLGHKVLYRGIYPNE